MKYEIPIDASIDEKEVYDKLLINLPLEKRELVTKFIVDLYRVYVQLYFTYLEINPLGLSVYLFCVFGC